MLDDKDIKLLNLERDISEIVEVLTNKIFDRNKAENIINKHNLTNLKIAAINSPLNPGFVRFEYSTDEMIRNNLSLILEILEVEFAENQRRKRLIR